MDLIGRTRVLFAFLLAFTVLPGFFLSPATADITPISPKEMSTITGREGITIDMEFSPGFTINQIDYTDADGAASASGSSGVLRFDSVCMEFGCDQAIALTGMTFDFDGATTVNGTSQGAVVINLPNSSGFEPSIVDVYLGDPAGNSAFSEFMIDDFLMGGTDLEFAAKSEGLMADIELNLTMNNVQLDDSNGWSGSSGTSGTFNIGSLTLDNGSGGQTNLEGMTVDADGSVDLNGSTRGSVVVGMPSGGMHINASNVDVSGSQYSSSVNVNGLSLSNTTVEIGAN